MNRRSLLALIGLGATAAVLPEIAPEALPEIAPEAEVIDYTDVFKDAIILKTGGWCAPSETVYGTWAIDPTAQIDLMPQISVRRGGIQFPIKG